MLKKILIWMGILCFMVTPLMAEIYHIPKEWVKEVRLHKKILKENPDSPEAKFELAVSYGYTGQIKKGWDMLKKVPKPYAPEVIKKYEALIKENPDEWRHHFKLAFGYFFVKRKEEAIERFNIAWELNPDQVWALGFIALIKGEMGQVDDAISICKKALKIEPHATAIHFLLAAGYQKKGLYYKFAKEMMIVGRLQTEEMLVRPDDRD